MSQSKFYTTNKNKSRSSTNDQPPTPPTPPSPPTNRPISLENIGREDEDIVYNSGYEFSINPIKLIHNSSNTRRSKSSPYPPRPQNPFILYRRDKAEKHKCEFKKLEQKEVCKKIGAMWNKESEHIKEIFRALARLAEKYHSQKHDNYKYTPRRTRNDNNNKYNTSPISQISSDFDSECSSQISNSPPMLGNTVDLFTNNNNSDPNPEYYTNAYHNEDFVLLDFSENNENNTNFDVNVNNTEMDNILEDSDITLMNVQENYPQFSDTTYNNYNHNVFSEDFLNFCLFAYNLYVNNQNYFNNFQFQ